MLAVLLLFFCPLLMLMVLQVSMLHVCLLSHADAVVYVVVLVVVVV